MKFSIGYGQTATPDFVDEIIKNKENISEVYFSFGGFANGRNSKPIKNQTPWEANASLEKALRLLSDADISLNLLFNATCYGKDSQSRAFFEEIGETVDYIISNYVLGSVTTTSPLIAKFLKQNFNSLDIRASVNMGISTPHGMDYVKDYFDSFYAARELNRDFLKLKELKAWCDANGKKLYGLANSGCLNNCSAHTFHDNLVAHETEISKMDNGYNFEGICRNYLKDSKNLKALLDNTSFIRPEDTYLYEGIFTALKLATRVNSNPIGALNAYISRHHNGSILNLLEPDHQGTIYPYWLENKKIKAEIYGDKMLYTELDKALIKLEEDIC